MSDILTSIDAATNDLCVCGCGRPLNPDGPSAWFATDTCQRVWQSARTVRPGDVYSRRDANEVYPGDDTMVSVDPERARQLIDQVGVVVRAAVRHLKEFFDTLGRALRELLDTVTRALAPLVRMLGLDRVRRDRLARMRVAYHRRVRHRKRGPR